MTHGRPCWFCRETMTRECRRRRLCRWSICSARMARPWRHITIPTRATASRSATTRWIRSGARSNGSTSTSSRHAEHGHPRMHLRSMNVTRALALASLIVLPCSVHARGERAFTVAQALDYPYAAELTSAEHEDVIAWVRNLQGVRNVWIARGPDYAPMQMTHYTEDDGQEITQLTFTADAGHLLYVRGGDHDANWPAEGNLEPDPASSTEKPETTIWSVAIAGGAPVKIAEGDAPAISSRGQLAFTKDDH